MNAIVTGANRGIGLELVRQLLARGVKVEAACRCPNQAKELCATGARVHELDVASDASAAAFAHELDGMAIDLLINNAGVYGNARQRMADFDYATATRTFEINALGALRVSQALLPHLRRGVGKKIAHISSAMGSIGATTSPGDLAYRVSKAALNMVSRSIALELRDDRIISLVVHPGWVRTDMGGPNAPTTAAESARGILTQIDAANFHDSGQFVDFQGERCGW
ncbi:MAG TPA: SDR family oxidoreductase [Kofleriaceae bacterium]|jgi:NAD(P)-dependent dehydrogenase (short-subunit alcohol dehydrogenase family)|nr:SDR family oxidoreductase [Kofleriaceae bacterium]